MPAAVPSLALADENWAPTTLDAVVLAFLRAEWYKAPASLKRQIPLPPFNEATLTDPAANALRLQLLRVWRTPIIDSLPPGTTFWAVASLREAHLYQLLVIGSDDWRHPGDRNEFLTVVRRRGEELRDPPERWEPPLLFAHTTAGPFTILEGNNRLVNYFAASPLASLAIECYVALSPAPCIWHLPDRQHFGGV